MSTLKKILPKKMWLAYNKFLVKHDAFFLKIDNIYTAIFYNSIISSIRWWYLRNVNGFFYRTSHSWRFFCLGWNDADWDWAHTVRVLQFKLERLEKSIRNGNKENREFYADQIKICLECLQEDRLEDYFKPMEEELRKRFPEEAELDYGDLRFFTNRKREVYLTEEGEKRVTYKTTRDLSVLSEEYKKERNRLYEYYENIRLANLRVVFHIMSPKISKSKSEHYGIVAWWD